jgi:hypothetical protein
MNIKLAFFKRFRIHDPGFVSYTLMVYMLTVLTSSAGMMASLKKLGASPETLEAITAKYRAVVKIVENPGPYTDMQANAALKDFRTALGQGIANTPGANAKLGPYNSRFVTTAGNSTRTTVNNSDSFPFTVLNNTNNTGKECGAKPVTITVKIDGANVGAVAPGKSVTRNVGKGVHKVVACFPSPFGCAEASFQVPKYTFIYVIWVCRPGLKPIDPAIGMEPVAAELFDPAALDVVFGEPPVIQ